MQTSQEGTDPPAPPTTPCTAGTGFGPTHVGVAIPEEFVEDVAELPAEHSVARQWQPVHHRPEGLCPLLVVRAQDARWGPVKEMLLSPSAVMEIGPQTRLVPTEGSWATAGS